MGFHIAMLKGDNLSIYEGLEDLQVGSWFFHHLFGDSCRRTKLSFRIMTLPTALLRTRFL